MVTLLVVRRTFRPHFCLDSVEGYVLSDLEVEFSRSIWLVMTNPREGNRTISDSSFGFEHEKGDCHERSRPSTNPPVRFIVPSMASSGPICPSEPASSPGSAGSSELHRIEDAPPASIAVLS